MTTVPTGAGEGGDLARALIAHLTRSGATVAAAESLTGGLVCAALTDVAGASAVVRGGVVAYSSEVKVALLGVDADLLAQSGAVDATVAEQMACGVRDRLSAGYGLATTGVAGPDPADGKPVGTVFVAVAGPHTTRVRALALAGSREQIRRRSVEAVLGLLAEAVDLGLEAGAVDAAGAADPAQRGVGKNAGGGEVEPA